MSRKRGDLISGIFCLGCALMLCYRSVWLGIGRVSDPGPGFTIFLAAATLALLSLVLLFSALLRQEKDSEETPDAIRWDKIALILFLLVVYGLALRRIGFVLTTFLLVAVFLKSLERKKWHVAILGGLGMALVTYMVFEWWLQARLPLGNWKF